MGKKVLAVRGAVDISTSKDEASSMIDAVRRLFSDLQDRNSCRVSDIISVQMTQTEDLSKKNAAAALREALPEYASVPLFCSQEPKIIDAPVRMIRVLLTFYGKKEPVPVYLDGATKLRLDLTEGS